MFLLTRGIFDPVDQDVFVTMNIRIIRKPLDNTINFNVNTVSFEITTTVLAGVQIKQTTIASCNLYEASQTDFNGFAD